MWLRRFRTIAPLTDLLGDVGEIYQEALEAIKQTLTHATILAYTDYRLLFKMYTGAITHQLRVVIMPLAFFSQKFSNA